MSVFTKALYNVLANDGTLTTLLGYSSHYYRIEGVDRPCIFTVDPAPKGADLPYIIVNPVSDVPEDTKTTEGRNFVRDIRCYTASGGSSYLVEETAERVWTLLHRNKTIVIDGYSLAAPLWCIALRPSPKEEWAYGRIVSVRFRVVKNSVV